MNLKKTYQFSTLKKGRIQLLEKPVIPAEAGIQVLFSRSWIPVFTGMTTWGGQQKNLFKKLKCYKKAFLINFFILLFALLVVNPTFSQVKKEEIVSLTGLIESVSRDFKFIVVTEEKVFLTSKTQITDEKGNILKANDLKPKLRVAIEAIRNPDGLYAKRIVIIKIRRV